MPRWLLTPRWMGLFASLIAVVALCAVLGWWQWGRATPDVQRQPPSGVAPIEDVHRVGVAVDPDDAGRRVVLRGSYDATRELLVVDRLDAGRSGVWVLTAFVLADAEGATVPVVRGWLPAGEPPPPVSERPTRIVGWLEPSEPTTLRQAGREPLPQGQVEIVSSAELLSLWQQPLVQGFVIVEEPAPEAPLEPVVPPDPGTTSEVDWQNLAYAIQWWLFGAFAVFWFIRMVRLEAEDRRPDPDASASAPVGTIGGADERGQT